MYMVFYNVELFNDKLGKHTVLYSATKIRQQNMDLN